MTRPRPAAGPAEATGPSRCPWCLGFPEYIRYHDEEWGLPCRDEGRLFELLILEGAQAGLSWATILKKREGYRRAFDGFNAHKMARYSAEKIQALLSDPGIVRNRLKVESAVANARAYLELLEREGGLAPYLWGWVDGAPIQNHWRRPAQVPARTALSDHLSKDLRRRGFRFVGSTICYAYMQSAGLVNDHLTTCHRHRELGGGDPPRG